jgi:hypothetical protein
MGSARACDPKMSDCQRRPGHDRVRLCLKVIHEGLSLVDREADASVWIPVGLNMAVQMALIAALSGYDTAEYTDSMSNFEPNRSLELGVLMARVGKPRYLNPPERVVISAFEKACIKSLATKRNALLHGSASLQAASLQECQTALKLIHHTLCEAPSFPPTLDPLRMALISDLIQRLQVRFAEPA